MNRRSFMQAILAASTAPWIVKAGVLMPVQKIWTPLCAQYAVGTIYRFHGSQVDSPYLPLKAGELIANAPLEVIFDGERWLQIL